MNLPWYRRDAWAPLGHLIAMVVGFGWILVCARQQWFFFDEWAFLVPSNDANLFQPHLGHWSTTPILVTQAIRDLIGLSSYWPYLLVAIAAHLAICQALWIIMRRVGVQPWVAVTLNFMFIVLGIGAENVFWAFQIGYMGAVALGLFAVILADDPRRQLPVWRFCVIILLSLWSLTFSGTALPVVGILAIVSWRRRGVLRTLPFVLPHAVIYLVWNVIASRAYPQVNPFAAHSFTDFAVGVPGFVGHMFVDTVQDLTPVPMLGIVIIVALGVFLVWKLVPLWAPERAIVPAMAAGGFVFAILTAAGRLGTGDAAASSGRYAYLIVCFLLPLGGLAITWSLASKRVPLVTLIGLIGLASIYQASVMRQQSSQQAQIEQNTRQTVYGAVKALNTYPGVFSSEATADPVYAPDLTATELKAMIAKGWINATDATEAGELTAILNMGLTTSQNVDSAINCRPVSGTFTLAHDAILKVSAGVVTIDYAIARDGTVSEEKQVNVNAGFEKIGFAPIRATGVDKLQVTLPGPAQFELCT